MNAWLFGVALAAAATVMAEPDFSANLGVAEQQLREGRFRDARATLDAVSHLADDPADRVRLIVLEADLQLAEGEPAAAVAALSNALDLPVDHGLRAMLLTRLGIGLASDGRTAEAIERFSQAAQAAQAGSDHRSAGLALANAARAAGGFDAPAAREFASRAVAAGRAGPQNLSLADLWINVAVTLSRLPPRAEDRTLAHGLLTEAAELSRGGGGARTRSFAFGYLGDLYSLEARWDEAVRLYNSAIGLAQQVGANDALYLWEWGIARALQERGDADGSYAAYRRAVDILEELRHQLPFAFTERDAHFKASVEPVYYGLVAAQMAVADNAAGLAEARETIELLKVAELRNYFGDDCVDRATSTIGLSQVSDNSLIVYPIALPDRLVLITADADGRLTQHASAIGAAALDSLVMKLRFLLEKRTTREYLEPAQRLYSHLVEPILAAAHRDVDTLVFVPHGSLNLIPMAALHDGERYLIDRYAVAVTPGLRLTDPRPLAKSDLKLLVVGLSESTGSFPQLAHVPGELARVAASGESVVLLDETFTVSRLSQTLNDEAFSVLHVATHGEFSSASNESYLLAHNEPITVDRLEEYVGLFRYRTQPLELLTLSACDTAAADPRGALGLSGIAVKSGARSAVGSLWRVNDQSSAALIGGFYEQIVEPDVSRAVALQRAQVALKEDHRYWHPGYWSAFILISNWL